MNKKSFTLIELLVVIAIIGILSSLVIARFSDWGDNARIANTLQWSAGVHRTLGANLVGHWPLNGDANDISGYGNDGVIYSEPIIVNDALLGKVLEFDGLNDYIGLGNISRLNFQPGDSFTLGGWIKVKQTSSYWNSITGQWISNTTGTFFGRGSTDNSVGIGVKSNWEDLDNPVQPSFKDAYFVIGSRAVGLILFSSPVVFNQYYHIFFVYTPGMQYSYINGEMVNQKDNSAGLGGSFLGNWNIMSNSPVPFGNGSFIPGLCSNIQIYDTALTAEEVGRIYAETKDSYLVYE